MTQIHADNLTAYEAEFGRLELDPRAQDLLFREARTANTFTDEPVTDEQVEAIYDLVKWAPTSMNNQPLRIVLVRSPEARARLVGPHVRGQPRQDRDGPARGDPCRRRRLPRRAARASSRTSPGARDLFAADEAARESAAKLNAALQIGYFIMGVRAAGLAAGPMTGFDADRRRPRVLPRRPPPRAWSS